MLPVTGLESQELGCIRGLSPDAELSLHQPPARQAEVMVRPAEAFEQALVAAGGPLTEAQRWASPEADALVSRLPIERRPWMLNLHSEPHLFVPVSDVTSRLRTLGVEEARIAAFLDRCADLAADTPKGGMTGQAVTAPPTAEGVISEARHQPWGRKSTML